MKIQGGLKGLTQQPAAMARWFLIASELSRLSNEAETFAGIVSTKQTRHHDASPSVLQRYEQNVNKLRDILMVNDPFTVADDVLMNIITKATMPDPVKNAIIQRNSIRQYMFDKFRSGKIGGQGNEHLEPNEESQTPHMEEYTKGQQMHNKRQTRSHE